MMIQQWTTAGVGKTCDFCGTKLAPRARVLLVDGCWLYCGHVCAHFDAPRRGGRRGLRRLAKDLDTDEVVAQAILVEALKEEGLWARRSLRHG